MADYEKDNKKKDDDGSVVNVLARDGSGDREYSPDLKQEYDPRSVS